jgi:hypothetical protein
MNAQNQLIESIQAAFQPSPLRIAVAVILVFLFIGGLAAFYFYGVRQYRKSQKLRSEKKYAQLGDHHHLLASDKNIIEQMAATLSFMNRNHLILTNQMLFNICAQRLLKKGKIREAEISELRAKLGFFGEGKNRVPISTASLPSGYPVAIRDQRGQLQAHVIDSKASELRVKVDLGDQNPVFSPGSEADIVYQNRRGTFVLRSTVISQDGEMLNLSHSKDVAHMQNGAPIRRDLDVPANVLPMDSRGQ